MGVAGPASTPSPTPQGAGGLPPAGDAELLPHSGEVETFDDRVFQTLATMSELFVCGLRGKPQRGAGLTMAGRGQYPQRDQSDPALGFHLTDRTVREGLEAASQLMVGN